MTASIASTMRRVMIQADEELLERAQRAARDRGVSFPQFVREAIERELSIRTEGAKTLACAGVIATGGAARRGTFEPDAWR